MDFNQNKPKKKRSRAINTDNFIEALRDLGNQTKKSLSRDLVGGVAKTAANTVFGRPSSSITSGEITPGQPLDFDRLQKEQQEKIRQQEKRRFQTLRRQEHLVFSAKKEQVKKEIKQLQQELQKLAKEMANVAKEVQVATMQQVVEPGEYHVSFFEHLKSLVKVLRQKLHDSANWLKIANHRAKRRLGYWGRVKKTGTKFMLSQERYMATQAG
jgi:predicted RNase H-like nuclease (RuvC/YqgF family)